MNGKNKWRLLNFNELYYLADRSKYKLVTHNNYFKTYSKAQNPWYWTNTKAKWNPSYVWDVNFKYGFDYSHDVSSKHLVRCMRGSQLLIFDNFERKHNIVFDKNTDPIWQDNRAVKSNKRNWLQVKTYCRDLSLAGYSKWRLPTIDELLVLYIRANISLQSKVYLGVCALIGIGVIPKLNGIILALGLCILNMVMAVSVISLLIFLRVACMTASIFEIDCYGQRG